MAECQNYRKPKQNGEFIIFKSNCILMNINRMKGEAYCSCMYEVKQKIYRKTKEIRRNVLIGIIQFKALVW